MVSQVLGRNALFECIAVSEPIHISRWLFGDTELSNSEKYLIQVQEIFLFVAIEHGV